MSQLVFRVATADIGVGTREPDLLDGAVIRSPGLQKFGERSPGFSLFQNLQCLVANDSHEVGPRLIRLSQQLRFLRDPDQPGLQRVLGIGPVFRQCFRKAKQPRSRPVVQTCQRSGIVVAQPDGNAGDVLNSVEKVENCSEMSRGQL